MLVAQITRIDDRLVGTLLEVDGEREAVAHRFGMASPPPHAEHEVEAACRLLGIAVREG